MNKYFEEIENNIDNVLQVLKNDEALCNMLVDMMKKKCNTNCQTFLCDCQNEIVSPIDWHEERSIARYTLDEEHPLLNKSLPNDKNDIPEYMVDFYNETTLSDDWKKLNDDEKLIKLNNDLEEYFKQ